MIATWMLAATALGLLAGGVALASERVSRLRNRQGRHVWMLALVVTCTWPLLAPALARPLVPPATERVTMAAVHTSATGVAAPLPDAPSVRERLAALDTPLLVLWIATSVLLLSRALVGLLVLHRIAQSAEPQTVVGRKVLITSSVGPAAFGIVRPRIVLPKWSLELDTPMRDLVVRHEVEHVKSADPAVLTVAWLLVALFPWNAGLWWIVHRLRTATELDCDHRVVRAGADRRRYAHLLMLIAQRQGETALASMIAGAPNTLPLRIAAMHSTPPARRTLRAAAAALLALVLGAVTASPVLARELARLRAWMPTALTLTTPAPLAQDTAKKPTKQVEFITRTSTPPPSKRSTRPPDDAQLAMAPGSLAPRYPEILKSAGISGVTVVQFVVDTTGLPIPGTLKVVRSGHALFTQAVQNALPGLRFLPARSGARNVKQLAQMVYWFEVQGFPPRDSVVVPAGPVPTFKVVITGIVPPPTKEPLDFPSDAQVAIAPGSQAPRYPEILKQAGVGGETVVQFVVDTTGLVIPSTLRVVRSGHALFTQAVQNALPGLRFLPARVGARNVKQLAQVVYHFEVQGYPPVDTMSAPSGSVPTFKVFVTAVAPK